MFTVNNKNTRTTSNDVNWESTPKSLRIISDDKENDFETLVGNNKKLIFRIEIEQVFTKEFSGIIYSDKSL